jgi:hypothetical protein
VCDEPHFPKGLLDVEEVVDESCLPLGSLFSETQDINHPEASVFSQITQLLVKLGERGDPSMAVLHYLREEKGISAEVNLWKRGRGEVREKKLPFIGI